MKPIIILIKPTGQISNNLFQHIHLMCFTKEINASYINHRYLNYQLGERLSTSLIFFTSILNLFLIRQLLVRLGVASQYCINNENSEAVKAAIRKKTKPFFYVRGGGLKCKSCVHKHRNELIALFKSLYTSEHPLMFVLSKKNTTKLAVHIRRTDYSKYKGGIYFYHNDIYERFINNFISILNSPITIIFFTDDEAFSIDSIDFSNMSLVENQYLSSGDVWQDYTLMSSCDYIIGPPSTFSKWASLIGSKPLYIISDSNAELKDMSQFTIVND